MLDIVFTKYFSSEESTYIGALFKSLHSTHIIIHIKFQYIYPSFKKEISVGQVKCPNLSIRQWITLTSDLKKLHEIGNGVANFPQI